MPVFKAPRGTQDILPEDQPYWDYVKQKAAGICHRYGYRYIETPVFEATGLFSRGVGQGTDIVEKEMYTFNDRGNSSLTLRPEGTAPVCRAYIEHGMASLPQPVRLYYLAPAFRYERPQAGRMRQHHQFGFEVIGDGSAMVDAEVIGLGWRFFELLGLKDLNLVLNSIGCAICRPRYLEELKAYYAGRLEGLCPDCQTRMAKNPLRLLDCKEPSCQAVADNAPKSTHHLCPECREHFETLTHSLELAGMKYLVSHRLVRGLDYYTRTVFEIQPLKTGSQSTIGGGGRYDRLIEEIGGKATPAIGFATGMERIILNLKEQCIPMPAVPGPQVLLAYTDPAARGAAWQIAVELQGRGTGAVLAGEGKSLKAQLRQANNMGMKYVIIIGPEELESGRVAVRDLQTGNQESIDRSCLPDMFPAHQASQSAAEGAE